MLTAEDSWLVALQAALRPLPPPPPGWPPFDVTPPEDPVFRTELTDPRPVPPGTKVPPLQRTPRAVVPADHAKGAAQTFRLRPDPGRCALATLVAVVVLVVAFAAGAVLGAAWTLRRRSKDDLRGSGAAFSRPWPRRFPYWTVRQWFMPEHCGQTCSNATEVVSWLQVSNHGSFAKIDSVRFTFLSEISRVSSRRLHDSTTVSGRGSGSKTSNR